MSLCSIASTYLRWFGDRGCTIRFTPVDRCRPESTRAFSVTDGSAITSRSIPFSSPFWSVTPQRLIVGEDALYLRHARLRAGHYNCIGPEVDRDAEGIFHQAKVFVAGPVQGLNARRDLQGFFDQAFV